MKKTFIVRAALALPILLGLVNPAKATPIVNLVINEVSSTTLTYSWQGGPLQTVTDISPDYWQFAIADLVVTPIDSEQQIFVQWEEPDYATSSDVNLVEFFQYDDVQNGSTVTVWSDYTAGGYPTESNGQVYSFNPPIPSGNTVQFNDNGDNSVPDGGSTLLLLGLAGMGMGLFVRKFKTA